MPAAKETVLNSVMRLLPSVDELLRSDTARNFITVDGERHIASLARKAIDQLRLEIGDRAHQPATEADLLNNAEALLTKLRAGERKTSVGRVINATGVIIHTNLGRAPLSEAARKAVENASAYCALEYDLENGTRGRRGRRVEDLIVELTGAESALIVNNCAAAAFFYSHGIRLRRRSGDLARRTRRDRR